MPQDPLTQQLLQRKLGTGQPDIPLPDAPSTGVFDTGMDILTSALGLRAQKQGDWPTALGSILGASIPMLPFGKIAGFGKAVEEAEQGVPSLLQRIFASNPEAKAVYERAMETQLPEIMENRNTAYINRLKNHGALMDLDQGNPRPIPTDTGYAYAVPKDAPEPPMKAQVVPNNGLARGANVDANAIVRMEKSGLTPEMIRNIRRLDPKAAKSAYPNVPDQTLMSIIRRLAYNNIR